MKKKLRIFVRRAYWIVLSLDFKARMLYIHTSMYIRSRVKIVLDRAWLHKDEFHPSLDLDVRAMMTMNDSQREEYQQDLMLRRNLAHDPDMYLKMYHETPKGHMSKRFKNAVERYLIEQRLVT